MQCRREAVPITREPLPCAGEKTNKTPGKKKKKKT
jgi:hypothetical protein